MSPTVTAYASRSASASDARRTLRRGTPNRRTRHLPLSLAWLRADDVEIDGSLRLGPDGSNDSIPTVDLQLPTGPGERPVDTSDDATPTVVVEASDLGVGHHSDGVLKRHLGVPPTNSTNLLSASPRVAVIATKATGPIGYRRLSARISVPT